jgi:hypothetical protein
MPLPSSPFHVKGVIYQGTQLFFTERVRDGLTALYHELRDDDLAAFMMQKFLPSGWYDVMPIARLVPCEARAMRLGVPQYLRLRTRWQAERDIGTIYRFLLKLVSHEQVALRVPRIIGQLFDFGTVEPIIVGPGHVELTMRGWPAALTEWCTTAFHVYVETAMILSGVEEPVIEIHPFTPERAVEAIPCVTARMAIRFT